MTLYTVQIGVFYSTPFYFTEINRLKLSGLFLRVKRKDELGIQLGYRDISVVSYLHECMC